MKYLIITALLIWGAYLCYKIATSPTWEESTTRRSIPEIKERKPELYKTDNGAETSYFDARIVIIENPKFKQ
ncbi:hypothetical protein UFOVP105_32 [uncultured Caudovirales phage]|uniref:Uncharacterized protein n=1 Tax=uncultured Caudovirales phage TaxID=2100421 RepID=A0A6J5L1Y5_9CAUD|nr:hypothetical protein UFOVP105_32 [uncultured Caudovirales phage]